MTSWFTDQQVSRTVFVASVTEIVGLVVRFQSAERTITLDRWERSDDGYRQTQIFPFGLYTISWSAVRPNVQNTYLTVDFDPPFLVAGDNITIEEDGNSYTINSTGGGGSTGTVIDGGLPDSTYGAITPIDGGTP